MRTDPDVFVIHSKRQWPQGEVFDRIVEWCASVGLQVVDYDDWEWDPPHDPPPDALGQVPSPTENPWLYTPIIDTDALRRYWQVCDVILIVDRLPRKRHSLGVATELRDLLRWTSEGPPSGVPVAVTLGDSPSDEVAGLARRWIRLESPRDPAVGSLIAVAWLVSRLQRSGSVGLEVLDAAQRRSSLVGDLVWFGPFWRSLPVDELATRAPIESWWSDVAAIDGFMASRADGALSRAWLALTGAVKSEAEI